MMELEDLLVQEGVAAPPNLIRRVLDEAVRERRHPVVALVEGGIIVEDLLAEVLARAYGTVVVDLDRGVHVEPSAAERIPAEIARAHLVLPIAGPVGGKLRVVFANPLDDTAATAVETLTQHPVQRLAGTVSAVRAAIEKAYAHPPALRDMPPEITRRVEAHRAREPVNKDTSPLHRLEQDAPIEQRHEALLLALIERGILTRADYLEALKRLLSGRREE